MNIEEAFSCGMLFFLGYINRKIAKDPSYVPNSLVRALIVATKAAQEVAIDRNAMGLAFDGTEEKPTGGYSIVIKRTSFGFEILNITDVINKAEISIHAALLIFNIQMLLDKHDGDRISVFDAVDILNSCFESPKFEALGDRWPQARDEYIKAFSNDKIRFPSDAMKQEYTDMLSKITQETKWEDYPSRLRAAMAQFATPKDRKAGGVMTISTTHDHTVAKSFLFSTSSNIVLKLGKDYIPPKFK